MSADVSEMLFMDPTFAIAFEMALVVLPLMFEPVVP
jgi:hypothetical protein